MIDFKYLDEYLKSKGAQVSRPLDNDLCAYELNQKKIAFIGENSKPLRISLRSDEVLVKYLSEKYESVMPGHKLDPKKWLTLIVTGQLDDQEIIDLVNRSIAIAESDI